MHKDTGGKKGEKEDDRSINGCCVSDNRIGNADNE